MHSSKLNKHHTSFVMGAIWSGVIWPALAEVYPDAYDIEQKRLEHAQRDIVFLQNATHRLENICIAMDRVELDHAERRAMFKTSE